MGRGSRRKRPRPSGVRPTTNEALRRRALKLAEEESALLEDAERENAIIRRASQLRLPNCIVKLGDDNASKREAGCQDIAALIVDPLCRHQLLQFQAHKALKPLLSDSNLSVRVSALVAMRNCLTSGSDSFLDDIAGDRTILESLHNQLIEGVRVVLERHAQLQMSVAQHQSQTVAPGGDATTTTTSSGMNNNNANVFSTAGSVEEDFPLEDLEKLVEELLNLTCVLVEGSDFAMSQLSESRIFVFAVVEALSITSCRVPSAECLHILSNDNPQFGSLISQELSPTQQALLNEPIASQPLSPTAVLVAVHLAGALVNAIPSLQNVERVLPILVETMAFLPVTEIQKTLGLLSHESNLSPELRETGVSQTLTRLRSLSTALDVANNLLSMLCDFHQEEADDEAEFQKNPAAPLFFQCNILPALLKLTQEVLAPISDAIVYNSIRSASFNADLTTIQHLYLSIEVGTCSFVASFMHLIPLSSFGTASTIWPATMFALGERWALLSNGINNPCMTTDCTTPHTKGINGSPLGLTEEEEAQGFSVKRSPQERSQVSANEDGHAMMNLPSFFSSPDTQKQLLLQIESLVEICWTALRKDAEHQTPFTFQELDIFTRIAWASNVSHETRIFVLGVVGCLGMKAAQSSGSSTTLESKMEFNFICGKFCSGMLKNAMGQVGNVKTATTATTTAEVSSFNTDQMQELIAEACNTLIDLYSEETFDFSAYRPLGVQLLLKEVLPYLKSCVKGISKRSAKRIHLQGVMTNLEAFLQYKAQHGN